MELAGQIDWRRPPVKRLSCWYASPALVGLLPVPAQTCDSMG